MDIKVLLNWIRKPVSGENAASRLRPIWGTAHGGHLRGDNGVLTNDISCQAPEN